MIISFLLSSMNLVLASWAGSLLYLTISSQTPSCEHKSLLGAPSDLSLNATPSHVQPTTLTHDWSAINRTSNGTADWLNSSSSHLLLMTVYGLLSIISIHISLYLIFPSPLHGITFPEIAFVIHAGLH